MTEKNEKVKQRYNRIAAIYDKIEFVMEQGKMGDWRQKLWAKADQMREGEEVRILEAGVGTGKNIPYYLKEAQVFAVDFSEQMLAEAEEKVVQTDKKVKLLEMDIQELEFENNLFDLVIASCVFCSVPNPVIGLEELKRVCKPQGKILLLEHMRTEKEPLGVLMDSFNWVSYLTWGANINRRTMENIYQAGLKVIEEEELWLDIVKMIVAAPSNRKGDSNNEETN